VIMMYVSVYPIAMSVRSTNVYEERSLGVFAEETGNDSDDSSILSQERRFGHREGESRSKVWGEYLLWHAKSVFLPQWEAFQLKYSFRQQLAFDMWWLGLALWLICIIERSPLMDPNRQSWFTIFAVCECICPFWPPMQLKRRNSV
jgi:Trk-type K+ transport system membrane component